MARRVSGQLTDRRRIPLDHDASEPRGPSWWAILREVRVMGERLALAAELPRLRREAPRGDGRPVMVVPGVGTNDRWTTNLRAFLLAIGYDATGWGMGRNTGVVEALLPPLIERVETRAAERGAPVALVGWSLGGVLSREVARESPDSVERVITLGSPIVGGPRFTAVAGMYRRRGFDLDRIDAIIAERETMPIEVPVFAVYSRTDGIVSWRACIDTYENPQVEHHEVDASHLGLVVSPAALRMVARLLSRRFGA